MCCPSSVLCYFIGYNFLILYNMKYVLTMIAYLLVGLAIGGGAVYCVFLLLSLIRGMVS